MSVLICASLALDTEIIGVGCVCVCRKEDYLAMKILIGNKLKKKKLRRELNPSVGVDLELGSFVCFGWLVFTIGGGKV